MVFPGAEYPRSRQAELQQLQLRQYPFLVSGSDGHMRLLPDRKSGSKGFIETDDMIGWSGSLFAAFWGHGVCYNIPYGSSVPLI